jgi:hypothetical protein
MPGIKSRSTAPLKPAQDALLLDNSDLTVEESVDPVLDWWQGRQPFRTPPSAAEDRTARLGVMVHMAPLAPQWRTGRGGSTT